MKSFTVFPLHNYKTKIAGVILATISIILLVFEKITHLVIRSNFNSGQIIQVLILLTTLGLYFVAFSKEKVDDDRVKAIRGKALQGGFGVLVAMIISLSFIAVIKPSFLFSGANDLSVIALAGLISYLLIFNIGLYFDNSSIIKS